MRCLPSCLATARSARSARTASTQTRHAQVTHVTGDRPGPEQGHMICMLLIMAANMLNM
jgi:hypothetical protein